MENIVDVIGTSTMQAVVSPAKASEIIDNIPKSKLLYQLELIEVVMGREGRVGLYVQSNYAHDYAWLRPATVADEYYDAVNNRMFRPPRADGYYQVVTRIGGGPGQSRDEEVVAAKRWLNEVEMARAKNRGDALPPPPPPPPTMTYREALAAGYIDSGTALQRGYVSRLADPDEAEVHVAGGKRHGQLYVLFNNPNSNRYCIRQYLRRKEGRP